MPLDTATAQALASIGAQLLTLAQGGLPASPPTKGRTVTPAPKKGERLTAKQWEARNRHAAMLDALPEGEARVKVASTFRPKLITEDQLEAAVRRAMVKRNGGRVASVTAKPKLITADTDLDPTAVKVVLYRISLVTSGPDGKRVTAERISTSKTPADWLQWAFDSKTAPYKPTRIHLTEYTIPGVDYVNRKGDAKRTPDRVSHELAIVLDNGYAYTMDFPEGDAALEAIAPVKAFRGLTATVNGKEVKLA